MIATIPAKQSQFFTPIPTIGQNIEFAGHGQAQALKDLFGQGDFRLEASASFGPLGMVEASPQGQESLFIAERGQDPLVTKDIGHVLGMILIPRATGNLLPRFGQERIIQKKKDEGAGLNLEGLEEFLEGRSQDLIHGPNILSQETGKAGERSQNKGTGQGSDHGRSMGFFSQLDKANNK
jgi:hypothetical protein